MKWKYLIWVMCAAAALGGCDPVTRHKVTSTIFDGVPALPPADQYCQDFHEKKVLEEKQSANKQVSSAQKVQEGSSHLPYKEKRCDKCHDKTKEDGLIKPKNEVCFVCHPAINNGYFIHGPASVGSCLECHEPHSSSNPALLKTDKRNLCQICHREARQASSMHDKVVSAGMFCMDCHNPHAGAVKFFLR